ncbi:MAG: ABC transporter permease [Deltaproteobacteria bacterium]|jgi:NitT/TauT family transport system permease protein|nr:ABC transporter permease [Deltaproteobacteria bacterium]
MSDSAVEARSPLLNAEPKGAEPKIGFLARLWTGTRRWLKSSSPWLNLLGLIGFLVLWQLLTRVFKVPLFVKLPSPLETAREWFSLNPVYGISIFTVEYYQHIGLSCLRVFLAFLLATGLGAPVGLLMGWKKTFSDYAFPILELLRPIPMLAWVPLAILMWPGRETSIVFLTFLGSFFATALNSYLGVKSIDEAYFRAAASLGASPYLIFRQIVWPGALPFVFTGLQISVGYAWFSLVAGEMLAGEFGLGYLIWDSYILVQYPVIVIAMLTLGLVGSLSSLAIRSLGDFLNRWRDKESFK